MVGESLVAAWLCLLGVATLRLASPRLAPVTLATASGVIGVVTIATATAAQLLVGRFASLPVIVALSIVLVAAWLAVEVRRGTARHGTRIAAAAIAVGAGATLATALAVSPVLTFDSWRFIQHGASTFGDGAGMAELVSAFGTYPLLLVALEGTVSAVGLQYTASAPAALGLVACVGAIVRCRSWPRPGTAVVVTSATVTAVAGSAYLLRLQLGYLNSHLLVAGLLSVAVGELLRPRAGGDEDRVDRWTLVGLACAGIALGRVEGLLVVALLLAVAATEGVASPAHLVRAWVIGVALPAVWYAGLAISGAQGDILDPARMALLVLVASLPLATIAIPDRRILRPLVPVGLGAVGLGLLLALTTGVPGALVSVQQFTANLFVSGGWGATWWVAVPLAGVAAVLLVRDRPAAAGWPSVVVGYVLLVLALGVIRDLPYRPGWGDSGNRMMIHVLPVVAMMVLVGFGERTTRRRPHGIDDRD